MPKAALEAFFAVKNWPTRPCGDDPITHSNKRTNSTATIHRKTHWHATLSPFSVILRSCGHHPEAKPNDPYPCALDPNCPTYSGTCRITQMPGSFAGFAS